MRILVLAVLTLAVLTMASGSSNPESDGNPAEHSREDSQGGMSSITDAVKNIGIDLWQKFLQLILKIVGLAS
ncbi:hypothetical protein MTO96_035122 [Rhipicephalus appendiculatus]